MLTRNGVCEQAQHVSRHKNTGICINGILRRDDEDSNRPVQKYSGVSIRKNVSVGSFYNTEAGKCTTLMNFHIFRSHFHFQFTFGTRTAHQEKIKPIDECIRTSNLSDLMYAHVIKYCLVYFCVAFSRVLRIMTQNES